MADVTLSYKGSDILELSDSGSATLKTGGTYCEADIEVAYTKPSGGGADNLFEVIDVIYDNKAGSTYMAIPISDGTKDNYLVTWAMIEHGNYTDGVLVMDTDISLATNQNIPIVGNALYKKNISNFSTFSGSYSSTTETDYFMYGGTAVIRASRSTYAHGTFGNSTGITLTEYDSGFRLSLIPGQYAFGKTGQYFKYRVKVHGWNNGTPNATPVVVTIT